MKTYMYDIPGGCFGKVGAKSLRKARAILRVIFNMRSLPPKSRVWL